MEQMETLSAHSPIRITPQRQVILEELRKVNSHPTANEVYNMVRARLPRIGLGTVYRNLDLLAENRIILKLDVGGTQKRYDATTVPHYHVRCTCCDKVDDVYIKTRSNIETEAMQATNYQILGHHVEFQGVCQECQKK